MKKLVCDRCGKDAEIEKSPERTVYFSRYILHENHYNILDSNAIQVDLCEECNKKFQCLIDRFMNVEVRK